MNMLQNWWKRITGQSRRASGTSTGMIKMNDQPEPEPRETHDPITLWPDEYALAVVVYRDKRVVLLRDVGVTREQAKKALEKIVLYIA